MGLDLVELVMDIEDVFEIQFSDTDAQQMLTVGDVYEYILTHTPATGTTCLSGVTFYRLRRGAKSLGIQQRLRPSDPTELLLPPRDRQRFWQDLAQATQLRLPRLQRPSWLVLLCVLGVLLSAILVGSVAYEQTHSPVAASFVGFTAFALLSWGASRLTRGWAIYPSAHHQSLRALAAATLAKNFQTLAAEYQGVHRQDVWLALRAIIVEQLGVPAQKVTPQASFVSDLGAG